MDQISRMGMDTSKHIFQLHGVNAAEMPVLRKKLRRKDVAAFFEKLAPTVIALVPFHRDYDGLTGPSGETGWG